MLIPVYTRIAPTPSGFLHAGNAFNFIITTALAKQQHAKLKLRIDDLDQQRSHHAYKQEIFETLDWLGIHCDVGPTSVTEHEIKFAQHWRIAGYNFWIELLIQTEKVYACACSRNTLKNSIPCNCKALQIDLRTPGMALRIDTSASPIISFEDHIQGMVHINVHDAMPNFVIRRKDGIPSYQVASLFDDVLDQCNLIVRGIDLLPSTAAQLWLASLLGDEKFSKTQWYHHPLLTKHDGTKWSKSEGAVSMNIMRNSNLTSRPFYLKIAELIGMELVDDLDEFTEVFNPLLLNHQQTFIWESI